MDGVCHPVEHGLDLGGDGVDVVRRAEDDAVALTHLLVQGGKIVIFDAFAPLVADRAPVAVLDMQFADIHDLDIGPGAPCAVEDRLHEPERLAL